VCYITDWLPRLRSSNSLVYFTAAWQSGVSVPFDGIPFAVIGRQVLECASGHHRTSKAKETTTRVCIFDTVGAFLEISVNVVNLS